MLFEEASCRLETTGRLLHFKTEHVGVYACSGVPTLNVSDILYAMSNQKTTATDLLASSRILDRMINSREVMIVSRSICAHA